jgi:lysophospholipase L1-like esterase
MPQLADDPDQMPFRQTHARRSGWMMLAAIAVLCLLLGVARLSFADSAAASRHLRHPKVLAGSSGPVLRRSTHPTRARAAAAGAGHWVSTWGAAPQGPVARNLSLKGFSNQTLREIVYTSIGGSEARIELSNTFGTKPLQVAAAAVGIAGTGAAVVPGTNHPLSFAGQPSVLIPPGAEVLSDPVALSVKALQRLAVSLYLPAHTGPVTNHLVAKQTNYVGSGDDVGIDAGTGLGTKTTSWYLLDAVDVLAPPRELGAVVTLGDSITDGVASTPDANTRWPNDLARRLGALSGDSLSVIDEGIGGNRVLNNASCCGVNAVARFQRDVAGRAGVREVILLEGVNDIGYSGHTGALTAPHTDVSAAQIIAGDEMIIAQAHADGLKIFGATLTPFKGARYWTPAGEAKRDAVNQWILTSGAFDGVINFAQVLADPTDPEAMNPIDNSGDHLHPNSLGYRAMADAVNISALVRDAG